MSAAIVNNRIAGTRITVFDVYLYLKDGHWSNAQIAEFLRLTPEQMDVAVQYIEEHKAQVLEVHQQIEERNARGNPPEVEAKLEATRIRMQEWLRQRRQTQNSEANGEGSSGRREL
jgi:uncharacterized protein (DUF433 family)